MPNEEMKSSSSRNANAEEGESNGVSRVSEGPHQGPSGVPGAQAIDDGDIEGQDDMSREEGKHTEKRSFEGDPVLAREVVPRAVTCIAVKRDETDTITETIVSHEIDEAHTVKRRIILSDSKSAMSSRKHHAKNKDKINKRRREKSKKARENETDEEKKRRREKRRKMAKEKTTQLESVIKRGDKSAKPFNKENAEGTYVITKQVKVTEEVKYVHKFIPTNEGEVIEDGCELAVISGRRATGADISGEFQMCDDHNDKQNDEPSDVGQEGDGSNGVVFDHGGQTYDDDKTEFVEDEERDDQNQE